jgi:predicted metalloprotease
MARWLRFVVSLGVLSGLVGLALPPQEAVAKTPSGEQADPEPLSLEDTVDLSVEDIQTFWKKQFPATFKGRRYEPIPASQIFPYDTTTGFPGCGDATPRAYVKNARYCPLDDTVAYDIEGLFPEQYNDFGNFAVAMILAHEWGHAIQERAYGLERAQEAGIPSIVLETQADCFAGTWARRVNDKKSKTLLPEPGDLDAALAGLLSVADQVGHDASTQGAHGSAFDRISAFQTGFDGGTKRCAEFVDNPPDYYEVPFTDVDDLATGGNLPVDTLTPLVTKDLDEYWATELTGYKPVSAVIPYDVGILSESRLPTCGKERPDPKNFEDTIFYCAEGDFVAWDNQLLSTAADNYGDFAVATLIATSWSDAVHTRVKSKTKGKARTLEADCLTGSWVGSLVDQSREPELSLSPGDLDEAMQALLKYERSLDKKLSAFDRAGSFRKGFEDGASACAKTGKSGG